MAFQPRIDPTTGKPCCFRTTDDGRMAFPRTPPCAPCREHFDAVSRRTASLRTTEGYAPPDPWEKDLAALRARDAQAAAARTYQPTPRPTEMPLDANGIPDPYFHDLEKLRSTTR